MYDKDIDFKEEFKREREVDKNSDDKNKVKYAIAISLYISLFSLGLLALLFSLIFKSFKGEAFVRDKSYTNATLVDSSLSVDRLTIINKVDLENASKDLSVLYLTIYEKDGYTFLIHKNATGLVSIKNEGYARSTDSGNTLRPEIAEKILNGEITKWENGLDIKIATQKNYNLPFLIIPNVIKVDQARTTTPLFNALVLSLGYISMGVILFFTLKPQVVYDFDQLNKTKKAPKIISSSFVTSLLIILIFNFASTALANLIGNSNQTSVNQLSINNLLATPFPAAIALISIAVVGPFVEELIFRKSIIGLIKDDRIAIAVSTVVFAFIHISTELISGDFSNFFVSLIAYSGGGVAFGYIYIKNNRNIWVSIYVHMLYNILTVVIGVLS